MNPFEVLRPRGLGAAFVRSALEHGSRIALIDSAGASLDHALLLERALGLALALERTLPPQPSRVGVCLPPGEAGACVNLALALGPRASVNLNPVAGPAALRAQIAQSGVGAVIGTAAGLAAVDSLGGESGVLGRRGLSLESLQAALTSDDREACARAARAKRVDVERWLDDDASLPATVLFSSGSTARPKAIQLSHANVRFNARAVARAFDFGPTDRLLGVLPLFHSFGYTVTLWAPILSGASVLFHGNALEARTVGELSAQHSPSVLLATPALYQAWMRRIEPEAFASVRAAVVGAQRLDPTLAVAWKERYGSELYEGYGCTELSPVVSANLPPRGEFARRRVGSVGRPLEGVEVEIRDGERRAVLPRGSVGDVWVRGPGVMLGYLDDPAATAAAVVDGWYDTGDVGRLDEDGFLHLTDRRSRFSKLGGEMVSHAAVESALLAAARSLGVPAEALAVAVSACPDATRGERLIVFHTRTSLNVEAWLDAARQAGASNLFLPRAKDFRAVDALPHLGSGKLDLGQLKRWAAEAAGGE